ncbi:MAG TPA: adenylate/guanylate cyclase domain-containing protein [Candidatus Binatia bacterium]|nr:adenylate/guanylate cyclase domain-containing protein [Candidatus Binatia bacterium]
MSENVRVQRKLAAILSADVAGYSRLMGDDEVATIRTLSEYRAVIAMIVTAHHGRVVDMPGDNLLAEFASAIDAVEAALAMQRELAARNAQLPEERRMAFRVGVNLGDIITEDNRIYGDGVNIAARVESLAPAGGICVSAKVHEEVCRKLDLGFDDLGEHELKNIATRVRVYRARIDGVAAAASPASAPRSAKPSILVLPFTNMSGAPDQEFFADGLTEDILTDLSRFRELFVISRNTSFKFKGQTVDVKNVARELSVQYVIEGSVRKAGNRVRVTVQLIDAESDRHVWAERYDRDLEDIFAIQDEVTSAIVATLPGRMEAAARSRAERKPPANMAAYECVLEAKLLHHRSNRDDNGRALSLIRRAVELDPRYAHAHAWYACILGQQMSNGWSADPSGAISEIDRELQIALGLDENDSDVHRILAAVSVLRHDFDKAVHHQQRALALNPNDDLIVVQQGEILTWLGQGEEGIDWITKAMALNPYHPERFWFHLARAQFAAQHYADAIDSLRHITASDGLHHTLFAACYAQMGDADQARAHAAEVTTRIPGFTIFGHCAPMLHYRREADLTHHLEALRKAGLPE